MTVLDALQATLADEHAALYTYGVLGARTSQAATPTLYDALTAGYRRHRSRRDQLRLMVVDAGGQPVPAAAAYELAGVLLREFIQGDLWESALLICLTLLVGGIILLIVDRRKREP